MLLFMQSSTRPSAFISENQAFEIPVENKLLVAITSIMGW
jgi:hypothetical protein